MNAIERANDPEYRRLSDELASLPADTDLNSLLTLSRYVREAEKRVAQLVQEESVAAAAGDQIKRLKAQIAQTRGGSRDGDRKGAALRSELRLAERALANRASLPRRLEEARDTLDAARSAYQAHPRFALRESDRELRDARQSRASLKRLREIQERREIAEQRCLEIEERRNALKTALENRASELRRQAAPEVLDRVKTLSEEFGRSLRRTEQLAEQLAQIGAQIEEGYAQPDVRGTGFRRLADLVRLDGSAPGPVLAVASMFAGVLTPGGAMPSLADRWRAAAKSCGFRA